MIDLRSEMLALLRPPPPPRPELIWAGPGVWLRCASCSDCPCRKHATLTIH